MVYVCVSVCMSQETSPRNPHFPGTHPHRTDDTITVPPPPAALSALKNSFPYPLFPTQTNDTTAVVVFSLPVVSFPPASNRKRALFWTCFARNGWAPLYLVFIIFGSFAVAFQPARTANNLRTELYPGKPLKVVVGFTVAIWH